MLADATRNQEAPEPAVRIDCRSLRNHETRLRSPPCRPGRTEPSLGKLLGSTGTGRRTALAPARTQGAFEVSHRSSKGQRARERGCPQRRTARIPSTAPRKDAAACSATTSAAARRRRRRRRTRASSPTTSRRGLELMILLPPIWSTLTSRCEPSSTARRSRPSSSPTFRRLLMNGRPSSPSTRGAEVRRKLLTNQETCGGNLPGRGRRRPSPRRSTGRSVERRRTDGRPSSRDQLQLVHLSPTATKGYPLHQ